MMQILSHTPPWVFALFVGLLVVGFMQTRNRNVKKFMAYVLPVGMVILSLAGVESSFGLELLPLALWLAGLVIVTFVGNQLFRDRRVSFAPDQQAFYVPGSWIPLIVIMAIFLTKYVVAVMNALNVNSASMPTFAMLLSLAYGCFSGYFTSRAVNLYQVEKGALE